MKFASCMSLLLISGVVISNGTTEKYVLTPDGLTIQVPKGAVEIRWLESEHLGVASSVRHSDVSPAHHFKGKVIEEGGHVKAIVISSPKNNPRE